MLGLVLVVAAGAVPIMFMSAHDPVGVVFALVLVGYCTWFWRTWRSRMRRYRAELAREGLTHGQRRPVAGNRGRVGLQAQICPPQAM